MTEDLMLVDLSVGCGGAQQRILALLRDWDGPGTRTVATLAGSDAGRRLDGDQWSTIAISAAGRWDPRLLTRLFSAMRRRRPTVVDAHNVTAQFWAVVAARLARIPTIVCTVHSDYRSEHAGNPRARWYPSVIKLAALLGARFVAVESNVAEFLLSCGVKPQRMVVLRNRMPTATPSPDARTSIRNELGVGNDFVTVFAGRLEPVKDVSSLIAAFAASGLREGSGHLWIAGEGTLRASLENEVVELGLANSVRFLGQRDDVLDLLAAADCVALPSRSEGLPYVVLEAASIGCPILSTRVGRIVDLLGESGAVFVDPGDREAIADALGLLAADREWRNRLGATAERQVRSRLPPSGLADASRAFFDEPQRRAGVTGIVKKLSGGRSIDRSLALLGLIGRRARPRDEARLHVLTYHRIGTTADDSILDPVLKSATPEEFDEQMALVRRRFCPVSIDQVVKAMDGEEELPPGAVLVTFDDAYRGVWEHALPSLKKHGIPATVFVPSAFPGRAELDFWWDRLYRSILRTERTLLVTPVGEFAVDDSSSRASMIANAIARHVKTLPHEEAMRLVDELVDVLGTTEPINAVMNWAQLRELSQWGISIESHTRNHPALDRLSPADLDSELVGSADDIEQHLGRRPVALAYPTGQSSEDVHSAVCSAGYAAAFTTANGRNDLSMADRLGLRRIDASGRVQASHLEAMLGPLGPAVSRLR